MTLTFGGKLESKDSDVKTSTLEARKLFLELIWEIKPELVHDLTRLFNSKSLPVTKRKSQKQKDFFYRLFLLHLKNPQYYSTDLSEYGCEPIIRETPLLCYFDFIFKNKAEFDELIIESRKRCEEFILKPAPSLVTKVALESLIPNWESLKQKNYSELLCATLNEWAKKWNLNEAWCLDFALTCLARNKFDFIDKLRLPNDFLTNNNISQLSKFYRYSSDGAAWMKTLSELKLDNFYNYRKPEKVPEYDSFVYVFKLSINGRDEEIFKVQDKYFPLDSRSFQEDIESLFFEALCKHRALEPDFLAGKINHLISELKNFQKSLTKYISKVDAIHKPFTNKTVAKREGDKHFRWTIENTIPPLKTQEKLANENNVERAAVSLAIKDVRKLISLESKMRGGRPKGMKDSYRRRRV